MTNVRGWKQLGQVLSIISEPHLKYYAILIPLLRLAVLYADVSNKMNNINKVQVLSIEDLFRKNIERN